MKPTLLLCLLMGAAHAAWQTFYSAAQDAAFLHLRTNELLQVQAGTANSAPTQLASPPANATLAYVKGDTLLAFYGDSFCEPVKVAKYDKAGDTWTEITTGVVGAPNFLAQRIYISQPSSDLVYLYGGRNLSQECEVSELLDPAAVYSPPVDYIVSNKIHVFNTTNLTFATTTTATSPAPMFAAGLVRLSQQNSLLIGGKSQAGWIGMNQLAIWRYSSWDFVSTSQAVQIDSRTNPLVLPLTNGSAQQVTSAIVLGGQINARAAEPYAISLNLSDSTGWTWNSQLDQSLIDGPDQIVGAVTFENTLITYSDASAGLLTGDNKRRRSSSGTDYAVNYYNALEWTKTTGYTPPPTATATATATPTADSSNLSTGGKIALSTVLPVSALVAALAGVGFLFYRKRKRDQRELFPAPRPLTLSPYFGSSRMFDSFVFTSEEQSGRTESITSWTEKRRVYDEIEHYNNQSAAAQHQGASSSQNYNIYGQQPYAPIDGSAGAEPAQGTDLGVISIGEGVSDQHDNPFYTAQDDLATSPGAAPPPVTQAPAAAAYKPSRASTMRAASATITSYLMGRRSKSAMTVPLNTTAGNSSSTVGTSAREPSPEPPTSRALDSHADPDADADADEFFKGRDVQVLVSSKRRSRLRITNPDPYSPSRSNSEHSTVGSLQVKKTRSKPSKLDDNASDGEQTYARTVSGSSLNRQNSLSQFRKKSASAMGGLARNRRESGAEDEEALMMMRETPEEESDLTDFRFNHPREVSRSESVYSSVG